MTTTTVKRPPNGLGHKHQPRPWTCTGPHAVYCPIHGDCVCATTSMGGYLCPLHARGSGHGTSGTRNAAGSPHGAGNGHARQT